MYLKDSQQGKSREVFSTPHGRVLIYAQQASKSSLCTLSDGFLLDFHIESFVYKPCIHIKLQDARKILHLEIAVLHCRA